MENEKKAMSTQNFTGTVSTLQKEQNYLIFPD